MAQAVGAGARGVAVREIAGARAREEAAWGTVGAKARGAAARGSTVVEVRAKGGTAWRPSVLGAGAWGTQAQGGEAGSSGAPAI